ncbi:hypothetical protein PVAP13_5NG390181 [Panicum virgatum]|uniref:Uncharacterized protein n=1 Tax=Panicum virgatum TaxID=38727 RepID=A0A8T0RR80_PANVG|nr:hypothetical protein PVAP13_5NG390181 [Panicum virgatum]
MSHCFPLYYRYPAGNVEGILVLERSAHKRLVQHRISGFPVVDDNETATLFWIMLIGIYSPLSLQGLGECNREDWYLNNLENHNQTRFKSILISLHIPFQKVTKLIREIFQASKGN